MVDEDDIAGSPIATDEVERPRLRKAADAFRTISEVADELHVPQHVLRFWESKFPQVRPLKRGGGRRYYRPEDVALLRRVADLLYTQGYTIKGVQRLLRDTLKAASAPDPALESVSSPTLVVEARVHKSETPAIKVIVQDIVEPVAVPVIQAVTAEQDEIRRLRLVLAETLKALEELRGLVM